MGAPGSLDGETISQADTCLKDEHNGLPVPKLVASKGVVLEYSIFNPAL